VKCIHGGKSVMEKGLRQKQYEKKGDAMKCPNPNCENGVIKGTLGGCCICQSQQEVFRVEIPADASPAIQAMGRFNDKMREMSETKWDADTLLERFRKSLRALAYEHGCEPGSPGEEELMLCTVCLEAWRLLYPQVGFKSDAESVPTVNKIENLQTAETWQRGEMDPADRRNHVLADAIREFRATAGRHEGEHDSAGGANCSFCVASYNAAEHKLQAILEEYEGGVYASSSGPNCHIRQLGGDKPNDMTVQVRANDLGIDFYRDGYSAALEREKRLLEQLIEARDEIKRLKAKHLTDILYAKRDAVEKKGE
jgi:hypothetical protein